MDVLLELSGIKPQSVIRVSGSKSETNRLLLLQALFPEIKIENASDSDDSGAMIEALSGNSEIIDVHHAGTAMRFLTAYFASVNDKSVTITGSSRMQERPIGILVDALRKLGADIDYVSNEGFPPLKINGKKLSGGKISLKANISSQYISALLLIAPKLENGLEIELEGEMTSAPYIKMTLALLNEIGIKTSFINNRISVLHNTIIQNPTAITIESDWSSASYFYSIAALSEIGTKITLSSYKQKSLQGDSALSEIYKQLGVTTTFEENAIILERTGNIVSECNLNLNDCPDIAQTIAVTCLGLGISCSLTGLHTLKIKETDRLSALKTELEKLGAAVSITNDSLNLIPKHIFPDISIKTYNDHRMAMAFAPLALRVPLTIQNADVVSKSFPAFWDDIENIGIRFSTTNQ